MSSGFDSASARPEHAPASACPCGSALEYGGCCGPLLGGDPAPTAERLMRSRYTAFVIGDEAYLRETWHPGTRPATLDLDPTTRWLRLEIVAVEAGVENDRRGFVEFRAWYRERGQRESALHELSRFVRQSDRWWYLDGVVS